MRKRLFHRGELGFHGDAPEHEVLCAHHAFNSAYHAGRIEFKLRSYYAVELEAVFLPEMQVQPLAEIPRGQSREHDCLSACLDVGKCADELPPQRRYDPPHDFLQLLLAHFARDEELVAFDNGFFDAVLPRGDFFYYRIVNLLARRPAGFGFFRIGVNESLEVGICLVEGPVHVDYDGVEFLPPEAPQRAALYLEGQRILHHNAKELGGKELGPHIPEAGDSHNIG